MNWLFCTHKDWIPALYALYSPLSFNWLLVYFFKVAICAGCNTVFPWAAFVIGSFGGVVYMTWSYLIVKMKIDDPLDAVAGKFKEHLTDLFWLSHHWKIYFKNRLLWQDWVYSFQCPPGLLVFFQNGDHAITNKLSKSRLKNVA